MQPTQPLVATGAQREASDPTCNPHATPTQPLPQPPAAPCPHCCGEGYLISQGTGYFDPHEECWMPNDDLDPCPSCRGSGCQSIDWNDPNHEDTLPQPQGNNEPLGGDNLPPLTFKENPMTIQTRNSEHDPKPIPDWPAQRSRNPVATTEAPMTQSIDWTALYAALSEPFEPSLIRYRAGATNRDKTKAQALPYVDPRAYEDRLNHLVPGSWEVTFEPWGDNRVICRLTIHGVTRSSTGEAGDSPEGIAGTSAESQSFKRACVKFGLGRHLYAHQPIWVPYDPNRRSLQSPTGPGLLRTNGNSNTASTLGRERAHAMHRELDRLGIPRRQHVSFASQTIKRAVAGLADLNPAEARRVWGMAEAEHRRLEQTKRAALPQEHRA